MRNITLKILRGIYNHMPMLNDGELYFATDKLQLYIGWNGNIYYVKFKKI